MGIRRTLLWPVEKVAGWTDDNPLSTAAVVVATGALVALVASAGLETGNTGGGALAIEAISVGSVAETALAQPAYVVAVLVGLAVFALYDG